MHGPPGTGKTHTAARVITRLVTDHGWRVGVVAQSHATVENLLDCVIDAGLDPARVAKKHNDHQHPRWQEIDSHHYPAFIADTPGCVIGGTAWDFANTNRVPPGSLDLLVIDEAGQFCLANTIAVAPAAANLLLLGDPQQLPQVSQGTHPEPVDTSALDWLVDGHSTLPDERGYFLDRTYRMHPAVCAAVSTLSYEGRLHSHAEITAARRLDGYQPGVQLLSVRHQGNSIESPEEADAIVAEIQPLLGRTWTDEHGSPAAGRTRRPGAGAVQRAGGAGASAVGVGRTRRRPRRYGRQVPGRAGAGGVHLDDGILGRGSATWNLVPAQQESAQRRHQPGTVRGSDRALGAADRVSAGHAQWPGGPGRLPRADAGPLTTYGEPGPPLPPVPPPPPPGPLGSIRADGASFTLFANFRFQI